MNKLETDVKRHKAIEEKGLTEERKKHTAYYYKLYRKGKITQQDFLYSNDSVMQIMAGF